MALVDLRASAYLGCDSLAVRRADHRAAPQVNFSKALKAFAGIDRWNTRHYDGTSHGADFARHFENASHGSPNVHASPSARRTLVDRVRYELANNSYLRGIVDTHTYGVMGRQPRLRMLPDEARLTATQAKNIERFVGRWAKKIQFGKKLRGIYSTRISDGEGLALISYNPRLRFPVRLDLRQIECDQLMADPTKSLPLDELKEVDGVILDQFGNPEYYRILRRHPGGIGWRGIVPEDFTEVPEEYVIHHFRSFRPGQRRGVPEIAPALLPAAALRRYTMATVKAAEVAASITFLVETDNVDDVTDVPAPPAYDLMSLEHNTGMALPDGWKGHQMKAEQPIDTYGAFKRELIAEEGRCLGQSANAAAADSSNSTFSSARLDDINSSVIVAVERHDFAEDVLGKVMLHFGMEAVLAEAGLSAQVRRRIEWWVDNEGEFPPHEWGFDSKGYTDPETDAKANDIELRAGSRTLSDVLMRRDGITLEKHVDNLRREREYMRQAGVEMGYLAPEVGPGRPTAQGSGDAKPQEQKPTK